MFLLLLLLAVPGLAQTAASRPTSLPTSASLDTKLEAIRLKHGVPALGCAATSGDKLLAIATAGFRKQGSPERVTANDRWHLGSCTKSMTATMLARLVERGKLRFETTIGEVFKDSAKNMSPAFEPVTIEQLLAHRGGVPADLTTGGLWARLWERKGTPTDQRRQLLDDVLARSPASPPGTQFLYSNAGYAIAGHMAEQLMSKPWEALMREELFDPLGMKDVGFGAPGRAGAVEHPWGHSAKDLTPIEPGPNADNPPAIGPAGTAHATLTDWSKYAALHLHGAIGKTEYLKPETFARIQARPKEGDYAFGWVHGDRPWANGHVLTHSGSNTMWHCVIWLAPERNAAFLAVCNSGGDAAARATDEAIGAAIASVKDTLPPLKR